MVSVCDGLRCRAAWGSVGRGAVVVVVLLKSSWTVLESTTSGCVVWWEREDLRCFAGEIVGEVGVEAMAIET
jgi:hypothetical protein